MPQQRPKDEIKRTISDLRGKGFSVGGEDHNRRGCGRPS